MKKIILERIEELNGGTFGVLKIIENDKTIFNCVTLEPKGESTDIKNINQRIMPRSYSLFITNSSVTLPKEYKGRAISLDTKEIENFKQRKIHFHVGNYVEDTQGCILLGDKRSGEMILHSLKTTKAFYDIVCSDIKNTTLIIKDPVAHQLEKNKQEDK